MQLSTSSLAKLQRLAHYEALARIVIGRCGHVELSQAALGSAYGDHSLSDPAHRERTAPHDGPTLRGLAQALETHLIVGFLDEIAALGDSPGFDAREADLVAVG